MKSSLLLLLIGTVIAVMNFYSDETRPIAAATPDWPHEFEGRPLEPLPLSATEQTFAQSFPGTIGVFASPPDRQVILRRVDRATRQLHDSATCLKAAGYSITGRTASDGWLHYEARRGEKSFAVREQIVAGGRSWTDVSDWFWHATFNRNRGPWLAVTVLEARGTGAFRP